jgi:D-alanyl-D-alanine carboxypeptidase
LRLTIPHRISSLILALLMGFSLALASQAEARGKFAALAVDARTGKILFDNDSNGLRHPASLTKMMTLYVLSSRTSRQGKYFTAQHTHPRFGPRRLAWHPSKLGV